MDAEWSPPLEPGRVVDGQPLGLFCAAHVTAAGGGRVDTRTWLFLPEARVSRVYPYGGMFETWRCSGDTCGRFEVAAGRLSVKWDGGAVAEYAYEAAGDGIVLDGDALGPARPLSVGSLAGRWIDVSGNVYAFGPDGTFPFGVGDSPGLGGTFDLAGLALVLRYADGDVLRRTAFGIAAVVTDAPDLLSIDADVFTRWEP